MAHAAPSDWCGGHGLPESKCTKCNPELAQSFKDAGDWCDEHGYPESACPTCNPVAPPAAGASKQDWCGGHGLPESKCTKCNPELAQGFKDAGDWCDEHGYPESACPTCNPVAPPAQTAVIQGSALPEVRFTTAAIESAAGIQTVPVASAAMGTRITTTARIDFNRNAMAEVRSPIQGLVREVSVDLGQTVAPGDPLFVLQSLRVSDLQARRPAVRERARVARGDLARHKALRNDGIVSERQIEIARRERQAALAEVRAIETSLALAGATAAGSPGHLVVEAPIAGTIIRRPAIKGASASESDTLATVVDTASMWALVDVPEWDADDVKVGHIVSVRVDGIVGQRFEGKVVWLSAEVDQRTRTVTARVTLDNATGVLRAGQFARASIRLQGPKRALVVPTSAVQRMGETSVIFVRIEAGVYQPRQVTLGRTDGRRVQVTGSLKVGESVVTTGAYLLRTELNRDGIGAGCCEPGSAGDSR